MPTKNNTHKRNEDAPTDHRTFLEYSPSKQKLRINLSNVIGISVGTITVCRHIYRTMERWVSTALLSNAKQRRVTAQSSLLRVEKFNPHIKAFSARPGSPTTGLGVLPSKCVCQTPAIRLYFPNCHFFGERRPVSRDTVLRKMEAYGEGGGATGDAPEARPTLIMGLGACCC